MNRGRTEIILLVDRSGSTDTIAAAITHGLKTFLAEQSTPQGELRLTLALFNDGVRTVYENVNQYEVPEYKHSACGGTAISGSFNRIASYNLRRIQNTAEEEKPEHVIFVLMTDGEEGYATYDMKNQSKDLYSQMKSLGWSMMYLGCQVSVRDWAKPAKEMGFQPDEIIQWSPDDNGVSKAFFEISKKTAMLRSVDE